MKSKQNCSTGRRRAFWPAHRVLRRQPLHAASTGSVSPATIPPGAAAPGPVSASGKITPHASRTGSPTLPGPSGPLRPWASRRSRRGPSVPRRGRAATQDRSRGWPRGVIPGGAADTQALQHHVPFGSLLQGAQAGEQRTEAIQQEQGGVLVVEQEAVAGLVPAAGGVVKAHQERAQQREGLEALPCGGLRGRLACSGQGSPPADQEQEPNNLPESRGPRRLESSRTLLPPHGGKGSKTNGHIHDKCMRNCGSGFGHASVPIAARAAGGEGQGPVPD